MPPGTRNALVPPSPNYLQNAGQFVGGVGKGLANQFVVSPLQMVQQSYEDPYSLGQGIYEGARGLAADPVGVVGNALRGMWNRAKSSPAGLGEVVGENIDPRNFLKPRKAMRQELDVYHGTPHTFDPETGAPLGRFRSEKIGTGEGAQVYGRGLYFAEHPDTAEGYAWNLGQRAGNPAMVKNVPLTDLYAKIQSRADRLPHEKSTIEYQKLDLLERLMQEQTTPAKVLANAAEQEGWNAAAIDWFKNEVAPNYKGHGTVYKVDLPDAKIEQMLDWDKPLSQQPEIYRKVLADKQWRNRFQFRTDAQIGKITGKELYEMGHDQTQRLGIPGIKYLDAGSRAGEKGTRNFVVFPGEEQHLNILSRD